MTSWWWGLVCPGVRLSVAFNSWVGRGHWRWWRPVVDPVVAVPHVCAVGIPIGVWTMVLPASICWIPMSRRLLRCWTLCVPAVSCVASGATVLGSMRRARSWPLQTILSVRGTTPWLPSMAGVCQALLDGVGAWVETRFGQRVAKLNWDGLTWSLLDEAGALLLQARSIVLSGSLLAHPRGMALLHWDDVPLRAAVAEGQDPALDRALACIARSTAALRWNLMLRAACLGCPGCIPPTNLADCSSAAPLVNRAAGAASPVGWTRWACGSWFGPSRWMASPICHLCRVLIWSCVCRKG